MSRTITADHRVKLQANAAKARKAHERNAKLRQRELVSAVATFLVKNPNASTRDIADAMVEVKVTSVVLANLVDAKYLKVVGKVETGKAGRPMHRFAPLAKARKLIAA